MADKDMPLLLRRRATGYETDADGEVVVDEHGHGKATGAATYLDMKTWPPRHEFSIYALLPLVSNGEAKVTDTQIELLFANAHAVYRIVDDVEHGDAIGDRAVFDDTGKQVAGYISTTGSIWGYLESGEVD